eukprot:4001036-Alexandrium_andersonii.AAC.1
MASLASALASWATRSICMDHVIKRLVPNASREMARATSPRALCATSSKRKDRPTGPSGRGQLLVQRLSLYHPFPHEHNPGAMLHCARWRSPRGWCS